MKSFFLIPVFVLFFAGQACSQANVYLSAGVAVHKNKKQIEGYKLPAYNPVYYAGFVFDIGRSFSLMMPVHYSIQKMDYRYPQYAHDKGYGWPPPAIPNLAYTDNNYTYESRFRYMGLSIIPCVMMTNKTFCIGAGVGLESATTHRTKVKEAKTYYHYDSTAVLHNDGTVYSESYNDYGMEMGVDWMLLFRMGYRAKLSKDFFLQTAFEFNHSMKLNSIKTYNNDGKKYSLGISVTLMYSIPGYKGDKEIRGE